MESFRILLGSCAISIILARHSYVSSNFDCWTHTCGGPRGLLKPHSLNCISGGQPEDLLQAIVDSVDPTETCPFLASFDKVYDIVSCSNSCVTHRSHLHLAVQYTVYFPVHSQSQRPFYISIFGIWRHLHVNRYGRTLKTRFGIAYLSNELHLEANGEQYETVEGHTL